MTDVERAAAVLIRLVREIRRDEGEARQALAVLVGAVLRVRYPESIFAEEGGDDPVLLARLRAVVAPAGIAVPLFEALEMAAKVLLEEKAA